jgi:superfamily II DNA/RNA helicase
MCTLWQRIGRVARDNDEEGVAIVLVEKANMDEYRQKKEAVRKKRQEVRAGTKRKANAQMGPPAKRPVLVSRNTNIQGEVEGGDASEDGQEDEDAEEPSNLTGMQGSEGLAQLAVDVESCRERYTLRAQKDFKQKGGKHHSLEQGSAIDDFVNAKTRGLPCRRDPPMVYFANDKISEFRNTVSVIRVFSRLT